MAKRPTATALALEADKRRFYVHDDPDDAARAAMTWVDKIRSSQEYRDRRKQFLLWASIYGSIPILGFGLKTYTRLAGSNRISLNVTANAIDALQCKITKNRPKPTVTTVDADYEQKERAEGMGDFITGCMYASGYYETSPAVVLDACVHGTGTVKVSEVDGEICIDRVAPWELIIDDREAMYGQPRTYGQRKYYDKQVLIERYLSVTSDDKKRQAEVIDAIANGGKDNDEDDLDYDDSCDQICVYEIWHLRSGRKAKDGKRIVCVRDKCLFLDDYTDDSPPMLFLRPMRAPYGFWGIGICEKLAGIQAEINRIVRDIQYAMHLLAKPHWMLENASNVISAHLDNDIATIIRFSGTPPQVYVPKAMSPEVYQHLQFLYRTAYEITGISQLSATGQKPPGLNSGVAMRTYLDEQTERFTDFVRCYEELAKGVAEKMVRLAKNLRGYKVKTTKNRSLLDVTFSEVDLKDYAIEVFPTSVLPDTPEGKLAFVQELVNGKMLDADDAFDLIDWPDTARYASRRLAARRNIEKDIALLRKGEVVVAEPIGNLMLRKKLMTEAYEEAKHDNVPEESLANFRNHLSDVVALEQRMNPPPAPSAPPMMPPPGIQPMPPGPPGPPMPPPAMPMGAAA